MPLAFSRDGRTLAALTQDELLAYINAATGVVQRRIALGRRRQRSGPPRMGPPSLGVSLAADLRTVAQPQEDGTVRLWRTDSSETTSSRWRKDPWRPPLPRTAAR